MVMVKEYMRFVREFLRHQVGASRVLVFPNRSWTPNFHVREWRFRFARARDYVYAFEAFRVMEWPEKEVQEWKYRRNGGCLENGDR